MEKLRALVPHRVPALCRAMFGVALALAAPSASRATEAKVLFGTGLSIDGITFSPRAFSSNWGGYSAMGTAETAPGSVGVPPATKEILNLPCERARHPLPQVALIQARFCESAPV